MDTLHSIALGLSVALQPTNLFFCFIGVFVGTLIGVLPGIGPVGTMSLLLPATFHLSPVGAIIMFTSAPRFTLGVIDLTDGVGLIPLAMGLFGVAEILLNLEGEMKREIYETRLCTRAKRSRAGARPPPPSTIEAWTSTSTSAGCSRSASCRGRLMPGPS
jgi:TctA family transporter